MEKKLCERYEEFYPMIKNRARSWARPGIVGLEKEDLESIGNEVFLKCCSAYDPDKCKFSTWLWKCLNNEFYLACNVQKRPPKCEDIDSLPISIGSNGAGIESRVAFKDILQRLSPDAQYIVNSALHTPIELIEQARKETGAVRVCKKRLQRHLVDNEGWGIGRCWRGFKEIEKVLSE